MCQPRHPHRSITADDAPPVVQGTNTGLVPGSVLLFDDDAMQRKPGGRPCRTPAQGQPSPDAPILEDQTRVVRKRRGPPAHDGAARDADHQDPPDPVARPALHVEPGGSQAELLESFATPDVPAGCSASPTRSCATPSPEPRGTMPAGERAIQCLRDAGACGTARSHCSVDRERRSENGPRHQLPEWNPDEPRLRSTRRGVSWATRWRKKHRCCGTCTGFAETVEAARKARQAHDVREIFLDAVYEGILPGSQVVVLIPEPTDLDERPADQRCGGAGDVL